MKDYKEQQNCPLCRSINTNREYGVDNIMGSVETRTLGALADKNSSKMSTDQKESLHRKHHYYKYEKPTKELPAGMERMRKYE